MQVLAQNSTMPTPDASVSNSKGKEKFGKAST